MIPIPKKCPQCKAEVLMGQLNWQVGWLQMEWNCRTCNHHWVSEALPRPAGKTLFIHFVGMEAPNPEGD